MTGEKQNPPDLHVHTRFSIDADGEHAEYIEKAKAFNLRGIGFSEHWDFDPDDPSTGFFDYESQRDILARLRKSNPDMMILHGAEVSFEAFREQQIKEYIKDFVFDYLIGSLHSVGSVILEFTDPDELSITPDEIYRPYFQVYLKMVRSGLFQIGGHFDYPKKYCFRKFGPFDPSGYETEIDDVLNAMIDTGMVPEINGAGFAQEVGEQYPSEGILARYKDLGGSNVVYGSDAHSPSAAGGSFDRINQIVETLGLKPVAIVGGKIREID